MDADPGDGGGTTLQKGASDTLQSLPQEILHQGQGLKQNLTKKNVVPQWRPPTVCRRTPGHTHSCVLETPRLDPKTEDENGLT